MKAITLWQPWASLLACGAKKYETRSWATNYRGPIAIHAALKDYANIMTSEQINALIRAFAGTQYEVVHNRAGGGYDYIYPYGAVIATAELVGCYPIEKHPMADRPILGMRGGDNKITENELLFGDWTPGRYAWEIINVQMLPEPMPAKGRQGFWDWEMEAKYAEI